MELPEQIRIREGPGPACGVWPAQPRRAAWPTPVLSQAGVTTDTVAQGGSIK